MPGSGLKVVFLRGALELRKRIKHSDASLTPDCESLHEASEDYHWNESFYFNFMDTKRGVGGWIRMAKVPNQETDTGAMVIYAGGQRILATLENGRVEADRDCLKLGGLACCREEPLKRWHLRFDGEMKIIENARRLPEANPEKLQSQTVELGLDFEGIGPCFNYGDPDLRALAEMLARPGTKLWDLRKLAKIFSEHYEQAGTVTGSIKIGNRGINFSGSGHRDHSWGPRDWTIPTTWTWLTGQFGDALAFNLNRMVIRSIDIFNGFITRDGKNYQLRRATLQTEFEEDGLTQRNIRFTLEDSGGFKLDVGGGALTVAPLQLESGTKRTLINEALTEYRLGDLRGYGISEYLHQLVNF
jgi:hypothetical protein